MEIAPQEFHILSDQYVIRTRAPAEEVTAEMVALRAKQNNLAAGDKIVVQCMDHYYREIRAIGEFYVTVRHDKFVAAQVGPTEIRQGNQTNIVVRMIGGWWDPRVTEEGIDPGHDDQDSAIPEKFRKQSAQ